MLRTTKFMIVAAYSQSVGDRTGRSWELRGVALRAIPDSNAVSLLLVFAIRFAEQKWKRRAGPGSSWQSRSRALRGVLAVAYRPVSAGELRRRGVPVPAGAVGPKRCC